MSENTEPTPQPGLEPEGKQPQAGGMAKKTKITIAVVIVVIIAVGGYLANRYWIKPAATTEAMAGDPPIAPGFALTDLFGQPLSLNQYKGHVVLLDFWATWCGPCRSEIPGFIQLQKTYGPQGFQIIGISEDQGGAGPVLDFYKQFGLNYRVALDNGNVGLLYGGIIGLPTTFLIGRDGRIYEKVPGAVGAEYFEPGIKRLLASSPDAVASNFRAPEGSETAQVETPAEVNSAVPGIDVSKLSKTELAAYEEELTKQQCTCGCKMSVLECRKVDPTCDTSLQMAREALQKMSTKGHAPI